MPDMKPALTPEEWEAALDEGEGRPVVRRRDARFWRWTDGGAPEVAVQDLCRPMSPSASVTSHEDAHALAALCLYGQPFGFTREDVKMLRWAATKLRAMDGPDTWSDPENLADRIEALLPPED